MSEAGARPLERLADRTGPEGQARLADGTGSEGHARLAERTGSHAWVHAAEAAAHDFVAGVAGDFDVVAAGVRGGAVSTRLTRSSLRTLAGLPGWLHAHGVTAWRVVVPSSEVVVDGVTPRLAVALPYALQAMALAGRRGLAAWIEGAPHCLIGPFRGAALGVVRAYATACDGCPARGVCPGVDAGYLERFGDGELSARALRVPMAAPSGRELFGG